MYVCSIGFHATALNAQAERAVQGMVITGTARFELSSFGHTNNVPPSSTEATTSKSLLQLPQTVTGNSMTGRLSVRLLYGIEPFEFDARIRRAKLPVHCADSLVAMILPALYLLTELLNSRDVVSETLSG